MIGQEIAFRNQIQKTLTGDSGCKELDAYNFWKERLQIPPFIKSMHYAALAEGKLSTNLTVGSAESLNQDWFIDRNFPSRNEVDLTLRIGEDINQKDMDKEASYEKNSHFFTHCVIDLEASSQDDTKIASTLSYATPFTGSKQNFRFNIQENQVSKSPATVNSFNIGCEDPNCGISSNATSLKRKLFAYNESMVFDFDLNKIQSDNSFDLNCPADFDKLKGIYADEASCSYHTSCEKVNGEKKNVLKENIVDIEITEKLEENLVFLESCENKSRLKDLDTNIICSVEQMNGELLEGNDLVQKAVELLFHFSTGGVVINHPTNAGLDLIENEGSDRPQCSLDSYESLVLKLEETSVDDYCVSSKAFEVDKFNKKECVGMWRRGRRQKDFQKDILPNLISLSRHEISEDVGIMDAVMRSKEYKRMRSKAGNKENWFTPTKGKRSRARRRYS